MKDYPMLSTGDRVSYCGQEATIIEIRYWRPSAIVVEFEDGARATFVGIDRLQKMEAA